MAPSPGPRRAPARATRTSSTGNGSPTVAWASGTAPTATALSASAVTLARRAPTRSTRGPASSWATTYGSISASPTTPISTGLPVVTRTSHGSATRVMQLPVSDTPWAA